MEVDAEREFSRSLIIHIPFPTHRLASSALQALNVDAELSSSIRRSLCLVSGLRGGNEDGGEESRTAAIEVLSSNDDHDDGSMAILQIQYKAKTDWIMRVAVNGLMESLAVVLGVMEELDVDVF